ncbi:MAG: S9 family peptidase, partial [Anaerolineae bacterium]
MPAKSKKPEPKAGERRAITADDVYNMVSVEDPRISPDGQWIAYVRVTVDRMGNSYNRTLWLIAAAGGEPIQLTRSGKDSSPRWSPDGKTLAFTSARDKKNQIYLLTVFGIGAEP